MNNNSLVRALLIGNLLALALDAQATIVGCDHSPNLVQTTSLCEGISGAAQDILINIMTANATGQMVLMNLDVYTRPQSLLRLPQQPVPTPVTEPTPTILMVVGLCGLLWVRRQALKIDYL